jgi:hypothetical protein
MLPVEFTVRHPRVFTCSSTEIQHNFKLPLSKPKLILTFRHYSFYRGGLYESLDESVIHDCIPVV